MRASAGEKPSQPIRKTNEETGSDKMRGKKGNKGVGGRSKKDVSTGQENARMRCENARVKK